MIDIVSIDTDIGVFDTQAPRAGNVISVQLGALTYAPTFGVDLRFFLQEGVQFQNESFRSYLLQRLSETAIDVARVIDTVERLYNQYTFEVNATQTDDSLVR